MKSARRSGGRFICIDLVRLAGRLANKLDLEETSRIVAVGSSGYQFATKLRKDCPRLPVTTLAFSRERERRKLAAPAISFDAPPVLVDDLAVSGRTLQVANIAVDPGCKTAGVGLLYKSRTTRRLTGIDDIRAGIVYERDGGGRVPINSLASLQVFPGRTELLAERYFPNSRTAFCSLIASLKVAQ